MVKARRRWGLRPREAVKWRGINFDQDDLWIPLLIFVTRSSTSEIDDHKIGSKSM
jgi:hypothetical protein